MTFQVTFHLDGCGVYYDPHEPIHLDDILTAIMAQLLGLSCDLQRDEEPDPVPLPLLEETFTTHQAQADGPGLALHYHHLWKASALFPDGEDFESLQFWRKKFRQNRIELTEGSPNLTNGVYREYNMPFPLLVVPRMIAYASGNCKEVKRLLKKHVKGLGKKRAYGKGRVVDITCEETPADWSWIKDGVAMRYLPKADGTRQVRVKPPYWNSVNRVPCCDVGEPISL